MEDHSKRLITEEFTELHCVSQQDVVEDSLLEDKEAGAYNCRSLGFALKMMRMISSDPVFPAIVMWRNICSHLSSLKTNERLRHRNKRQRRDPFSN
ncbi:hypothetical protein AVEN_86500-1 [Araneus ventricosus]|uniref:Uncharacterized protein n=1 Tax=Araneus ventricosus TaxID=182803 RepID=A0A4Y2JNF6_ARAVE|nr:hypothetical protein AVEN_86500-1 [Araneus ventricosus]